MDWYQGKDRNTDNKSNIAREIQAREYQIASRVTSISPCWERVKWSNIPNTQLATAPMTCPISSSNQREYDAGRSDLISGWLVLAFAAEQGFSLLVEQIDQDIDKSGWSELLWSAAMWTSDGRWVRLNGPAFGVDRRPSANCALVGDSVDESDVNNFAE